MACPPRVSRERWNWKMMIMHLASWIPLLLVALLVYGILSSRRFKRCEAALFSHHGSTAGLQKLNDVLDRLNRETTAFQFNAEEQANISYRGHSVTLARGKVGFETCGRYGPSWGTGERVFVVCSAAEAKWASEQRDVLQQAYVGSEVAVYWVRNVIKMADDVGRGCFAGEGGPSKLKRHDHQARRLAVQPARSLDGNGDVVPKSMNEETPKAQIPASCLRWFEPSYDEVALLLISVTFAALVGVDSGLRNQIVNCFMSPEKGATGYCLMWTGVILGGMALSIFHAFSSRPRTVGEKAVMGAFAMATNGIAGIACGMELLEGQWRWSAIFPVWNIVSGCVLLYLVALDPEDAVTDEHANLAKFVVGLALAAGIFAYCQYAAHLTWAMTFSICVAYSTSIDQPLRRILRLWAGR